MDPLKVLGDRVRTTERVAAGTVHSGRNNVRMPFYLGPSVGDGGTGVCTV